MSVLSDGLGRPLLRPQRGHDPRVENRCSKQNSEGKRGKHIDVKINNSKYPSAKRRENTPKPTIALDTHGVVSGPILVRHENFRVNTGIKLIFKETEEIPLVS